MKETEMTRNVSPYNGNLGLACIFCGCQANFEIKFKKHPHTIGVCSNDYRIIEVINYLCKWEAVRS